jgi:sodium/hydrogen antiporter
VLSLTVIRMVPVALALVGGGLGRRAAASIGWFGPRGLASVVFALLALEDLGEQVTGLAVTVIAVAVLFSVIAHGPHRPDVGPMDVQMPVMAGVAGH